MDERQSAPRSVRIERGIYQRSTGVFEVGYKDEIGRLRWKTVDGGVLAARKVRDDLSARRARGESVGPKPKLRFSEAADAWLTGPVLDLRDTTQAKYRCIVNEHLRPRFDGRRLDRITADDLANAVRELRTEGKGETTIAVVLAVVGQVYRFAARRLGWSGTIPTTLMLASETDLHRRAAGAHDRGSARTLPNTLHRRRADGSQDLRTVRADVGRCPDRESG
jgi:hypothetical protein